MLGFSALGELPLAGLPDLPVVDVSTSDTVTFAEYWHNIRPYDLAMSDTLEFVESNSRTWPLILSDTLSFTSQFNTVNLIQTTSDILELSEDFGYTHSFSLALTESFTLVSTFRRSHVTDISDTITFTDSFTKGFTRGYTLEQSLNFAESYGEFLVPHDGYADAVAFSETLGLILFPAPYVSDALVLVEGLVATNKEANRPSDIISLGETLAHRLFAVQRPSDTLTFTDSFIGGLADSGHTTTDTVTFTGTFTARLFPVQRMADFVGFGEETVLNSTRSFGFCDCITFDERFARVRLLETSDTLTFSDNYGRLGLGDTLTFVESYDTNILAGRCCDEQYLPDRTITESLTLVEDYGVGKTLHILVSEELVLQDTVMYI